MSMDYASKLILNYLYDRKQRVELGSMYSN